MIQEIHPSEYRHEYKYLCSAAQNAVLKARARGLLKPDIHAGPAGCYRIRSLYFDSPQDSCYYENEGGSDLRDKYRIRIYNADPTHIALEKKSKIRGMTRKRSASLTVEQCRSLMEGRILVSPDMPEELLTLLLEMQGKCMRPAVIVEYLRYPFVEKNGNVRITFDEHITSSNDLSHFLNQRLLTRPVLEKGTGILEVKWDEFLPGYIKNFLETGSLQHSSFSKYYMCRKYNIYGGIRT